MVRITVFIFIISFILMPGVIIGQSEQITSGNPQLAEPLVREGDLAVRLVEALNLGTALTEAEAESILISIGITPKNGWIADYPITPDITSELQATVSEAAESGALAVAKEAALQTLQDVLSDYNLYANTDTSGQGTGETSAPDYPDSTEVNDYYRDEGPPVVTYYAPPPDYAYLYSWVSYPFRWRGSRFPGFFVRKRFHVWVHGPEGGHGEYVSNYFHDSKTDKIFRVDPMNRPHGGALAEIGGARQSSPSAQSVPVAVPRPSQERTITRAPGEFRGYGASGPSTGTRSSTFERSGNSSFERNASDRGFQSRSSAGQIPGKGASGGGSRDGSARGGGGVGGFHGGGGGGSTGGVRH